jgi:hypothetical protein
MAFTGAAVSIASSASAEPNPCAGINGDKGTGGDYYDGITADHEWSKRRIYGTWFNCSGGVPPTA